MKTYSIFVAKGNNFEVKRDHQEMRKFCKRYNLRIPEKSSITGHWCVYTYETIQKVCKNEDLNEHEDCFIEVNEEALEILDLMSRLDDSHEYELDELITMAKSY